jgi:DNA-binding LacI/PurR family transcriptional regulator
MALFHCKQIFSCQKKHFSLPSCGQLEQHGRWSAVPSLFWAADSNGGCGSFTLHLNAGGDLLLTLRMKKLSSKKGKVGLREIARLAKVSLATVSRVLNGNTRVEPSLQKSVLEAAAQLNFDLSSRNKTKALAFLLGNRAMLHAFHSRVLIGAEAYCTALGWDMVFLSHSYSPAVSHRELHPPQILQRHDAVRAVILAGSNSMNMLQFLKKKNITFSVLGNNVLDAKDDELREHDVVFADDIQGAFDMTRYLVTLGHRNVGFVGNTRLPWFARCYAGYRRAMDEAGLAQRLNSTDSEDDVESGYIGTKSLLTRHPEVTAILAGDDPTAHGVYKALRDSGRRIPEDISVCGCNDTVGSWGHPALTTIREFPEQLGKELARVVLNRIESPGLEPQRIVVPTELIKRDSCRPILVAPDLEASSTVSLSATRLRGDHD